MEAYASTDAGKIAVLGMGPGEGIVAQLSGGSLPQEMAGTPDGGQVLVGDGLVVVRHPDLATTRRMAEHIAAHLHIVAG